MTLNNKYKMPKIHQCIDREENPKKPILMHKLFEMKGKYDFNGLDLREYGWKKVHALTPQQKKKLEEDPNYIDYEETMVYAGPQGMAVMYLNYKTDYHQVDIILRNYPEDTSQAIEGIKLMFERNLEGKLKERVELHLNSIDNIGTN